MMKRADSLDALRGLTIAMMVLCGTIINWVLPVWNSHCQVPPGVGFDPSIYGITWVDLVFPFFLFSMGAAIPFSTASRLEKGFSRGRLVWEGVWRGLKLAFFAIFIQNMYPWVISPGNYTAATWATTLTAFFVLFPLFMRLPGKQPRWLTTGLPVLGIILACTMMWLAESGRPLSEEFMATDPSQWGIFNKHLDSILYKSNIIILVLANMAAFGTVIYVLTAARPLWRLAILPLLMAIILCKDAAGSWQAAVFNWSPFPWLYQFNFLKYLFVIIPGTIAGEYLREWIKNRSEAPVSGRARSNSIPVAILSFAIIVVNVTLLFGRHLTENLYISVILVVSTVMLSRMMTKGDNLMSRLTVAGGYLLILGLFFEAFEGGIRKDDSTFSYYFVTSGLAFYCMAMLVVICDVFKLRTLMAPFTYAGKNPMVAYVAPTMLIYPIMNLCGVGESAIDFWASTWWLGLLRGIVFTAIAIAVAALLAKKKIVWRT